MRNKREERIAAELIRDVEKIISEIFGITTATPVTEQELIKTFDGDFSNLQGMVFLPSGDGYLLTEDEQ